MFRSSRAPVVLVRRAAVAVLALLTASCGIEKQGTPALSGPSEFGLSITLSASPDVIVQDGESQSAITAEARDAAGAPVPNLALLFEGAASDTTAVPSVRFTQTIAVTDAAGRATVGVVAPPAPATVPPEPLTITVGATPVGTGIGGTQPRSVRIRLTPPEGTPVANNPPVPSFTVVPAVANVNQSVAFDASGTTDDGQPCGTACSYQWDFGDFTTGSGITASRAYTLPGSYTVTLTVVDPQGGVASTTRTVTVNGPAAPVANFTVTPASPTAGAQATFNASTSTVGTGATITLYAWDFGDGTATQTTTVPAILKTYAAANTYIVTLTITDSLGRTATRTATVTVQ